MSDTESTTHPHEPQIPPAFDAEGRCLVCVLMVRLGRAADRVRALEDGIREQGHRCAYARTGVMGDCSCAMRLLGDGDDTDPADGLRDAVSRYLSALDDPHASASVLGGALLGLRRELERSRRGDHSEDWPSRETLRAAIEILLGELADEGVDTVHHPARDLLDDDAEGADG